MNRSAIWLASILLFLAGCFGMATAKAAIVSYVSDADFLANAGFSKSFGATSRWGNNPAASGDWEYAVVNAADAPVGTPGLVLWNEHNVHEAHFSYTGLTAQYIMCDTSIFGDTGAQAVTGGSGINALAFRARAGDDDLSILGSIIVFFDVDNSFVELGDLTGDQDAEYLMLVDDRLAHGFQVWMLAALFDEGVPSTAGSIPFYGLKVGTSTVPVPAAAWLFGSGLALLGWLRRKPSQAA